jgi:hypothetical protein
MANAFGLRDYRLEVNGDGLRDLGAIEGNIDKLIANRMKKRGMSWTIKGVQRMSRLVSLREMSKLHSWITHKDKLDTQPLRERIRKKTPSLGKDDGSWLKVGLSALYALWATSKLSLCSNPPGIDSWSRRFNLTVIWDCHQPTVDSHPGIPR